MDASELHHVENLPAALRRLCIAIDVTGYSRRSRVAQLDVQRHLVRVVERAAAAAGVGSERWEVQPAGDGVLGLLPVDTDEFRFLPRFLEQVGALLAELNAPLPPADRVRVRVAVDHGLVHPGHNGYVGSAVVNVKRIVDAAALRSALDSRPAAHLAVAVSDHVYSDVLADAGFGAFRRVRAATKDRRLTVWVCVPGFAPPAPRSPRVVVGAAAAVVVVGGLLTAAAVRSGDGRRAPAGADRTGAAALSGGPATGSPATPTALTATVECAGGCRTGQKELAVRGRVSRPPAGDDALQVFVRSETGAWYPTTAVTLAADLSWAGRAGVGPATVTRSLPFRICLFASGAPFRAAVAGMMRADPAGVSANGISPLPAGTRELACADATRVP